MCIYSVGRTSSCTRSSIGEKITLMFYLEEFLQQIVGAEYKLVTLTNRNLVNIRNYSMISYRLQYILVRGVHIVVQVATVRYTYQ